MSIQAHSPLSDIQIPMSDIETAITNYAAGKLTPARHALIACAIELNPDLAEFAALNTSVAASLLDEVKPVSLSPLFIGKVLETLSFGHPYDVANDHNPIVEKAVRRQWAQGRLRQLSQRQARPIAH